MAVIVNSGKRFILNAIRMNTKLFYTAVPLSTLRYNLTFRHVKLEFLPQVEEKMTTQLKLLV